MAKKSKLDLFAKTGGDLDAGNIKPVGVGLREAEIAALDNICAELGAYLNTEPTPRNAVMRIAIRRFIEAYLAGELSAADLGAYFERPEKPKPRLKF